MGSSLLPKLAGVAFVKQHGLNLNPEEQLEHSRATTLRRRGYTLPHDEVDVGVICTPE
jgi:hypothetical protein